MLLVCYGQTALPTECLHHYMNPLVAFIQLQSTNFTTFWTGLSTAVHCVRDEITKTSCLFQVSFWLIISPDNTTETTAQFLALSGVLWSCQITLLSWNRDFSSSGATVLKWHVVLMGLVPLSGNSNCKTCEREEVYCEFRILCVWAGIRLEPAAECQPYVSLWWVHSTLEVHPHCNSMWQKVS